MKTKKKYPQLKSRHLPRKTRFKTFSIKEKENTSITQMRIDNLPDGDRLW